MSIRNSAKFLCSAITLQLEDEDKAAVLPSPLAGKTATAPAKPSRHIRAHSPIPVPSPSPDPSPLLQRRVIQSEVAPSGDFLIPIQHGGNEGRGGNVASWRPLSPSLHMQLQSKQSTDSDVFSGTTHENVSDFGELSNSKRASLESYHSETSDTVSVGSSDASKSMHTAGSIESRGSVFGSTTSDKSVTATRTSSGSASLRKPKPPPKPKSLMRGKTWDTPPRALSVDQLVKKKSEGRPTAAAAGGGGGGIGTNERDTPPPKPPRPMRGSVKREQVEWMVEEGQKGGSESERGRGGGGVGEGKGGGGGGGGGTVPPPKPARRNRSVKAVGLVQDVTLQRKSRTMLPRTSSGASDSSAKRDSQSSIDSVPGVPRRLVPTPKPRTGSSGSRGQTESLTHPPPSLRETIAARLSSEGIDLTTTPYSNVVCTCMYMYSCMYCI